eukprot:COSAG02_NODE_39476_length_416_cov_2.211356_1_plen_22_part_10
MNVLSSTEWYDFPVWTAQNLRI